MSGEGFVFASQKNITPLRFTLFQTYPQTKGTKMTPDQITQIRKLLKRAKQEIKSLTPAEICYPLYGERVPIHILDETLALLPCGTCGDTGIKAPENGCGVCLEIDGNCRVDCPCPDCQS